MAHLIDQSRGFNAIAYVGEAPWHQLGTKLTAGAPIEQWIKEAGLDYAVLESPLVYTASGAAIDGIAYDANVTYPNRKALYRVINGAPQELGILSEGYKTVQPERIIRFFDGILKREGATLDVAGTLDDGKRVWALAKLAEGADILDGDIVEPYLLCATSYDGSMSTVAKLTAIRVVCHNTITAAVGTNGEGQTEKNRDGGIVRVSHDQDFDADKVRIDLGITFDAWERFLFVSRKLARTQVDDTFATQFLKTLLPTPVVTVDGKKVEGKVEESRAYVQILGLFKGGAIGADRPSANGTAFGLLNAVTEYVDHQRGNDSKRLSAAWFGTGEGLKTKALSILEAVAA